jgi:cytochrome b subunit of formate dehydrogenase
MKTQRVRRLLQTGIVAGLFLSFLPAPGKGQGPEKARDRRCLNCHGQKHIATISPQERGTMVVTPESGLTERKNPEKLFVDPEKITRNAHSQLVCGDCHSGVETLPHPAHLPKPGCKNCHGEEAENVSRSRHAEMLQRSEPPAPYCWDCHGSHEILPQAEVNPLDKIRICASCHLTHSGRIEGVENGALLVRSYLDSVHGRNTGAPGSPSVGATCEDCHGNHDILPVKDPRSRVNRRNISGTCGRCHPEVLKEFESTVHAEVAHRNDPSLRPAVCSDCHTAHAITHAGTPEFQRDLVNECGSCHANLYRTYRDTYHGQVQPLGGTRAARCSDCHGTHNIRRPADPASTLSAANRPQTCARCHKQLESLSASAQQNFIAYRPHADFRDKTNNPELFFIWRFSIYISIALLLLWGLHWAGWLNRTLRGTRAEFKSGATSWFLRFKPLHRWMHLAVMCCIFGLILTGLPLKLSRHPAIASLTTLVANAETLGFLHRVFAVLLGGTVLFHLICMLAAWKKGKQPFLSRIWGPGSLLPTMADVRQFAAMFRWFAHKGERPALDRWSYREKFDYWAAAATLGILASSGIVLWFPVFFAGFISGYWFNAAMIVHGYAGLLAMGSILLVHLLNSSLRREGCPVNNVMFVGYITENELKTERSARYERLAEAGTLDALRVAAVSRWKLKAATFATAAAQILGIGLILLIVVAIMV